jgi:hypothetical protein
MALFQIVATRPRGRPVGIQGVTREEETPVDVDYDRCWSRRESLGEEHVEGYGLGIDGFVGCGGDGEGGVDFCVHFFGVCCWE